ncbi:insulin-like peptide INSL5 [Macrotis lagotis]|uniref:insulin-like peptide INSL5 n=1 Tax=Macrotis lagotis TaxID=92651 RepID=UPI003D691919
MVSLHPIAGWVLLYKSALRSRIPSNSVFTASPVPPLGSHPLIRTMKGFIWAFFLLSALVAISGVRGKEVLKVCGRDFIRAIVYTCGGSRWKRDLQGAFEDRVEGKKYFEVPDKNGVSDDLMDDGLYVHSPDDEILLQKHQPVGTRQLKRQAEAADLAVFCCQTGCTVSQLSKLC